MQNTQVNKKYKLCQYIREATTLNFVGVDDSVDPLFSRELRCMVALVFIRTPRLVTWRKRLATY